KPDVCPRTPRDWSKVDVNSPEVEATFKDMVSHHVAMTSTLAVFELGYANRPPLDQRVLDAMYTDTRASYLTNRARADQAARSEVPLKKAMEYDVAFVKAGGLLAAGVDPTGNGGALPGFGDQRNFELLIEAGFSAPQAIQILSANGAKVLGEYGRFGSIEAGKLADLVVIDGNPAATPAENKKVLIENGRIKAVGSASSVTVPANAKVMDLAGHTVVPGFVGMHDHIHYSAAGWRNINLSFSSPRLYLASGVTTIR